LAGAVPSEAKILGKITEALAKLADIPLKKYDSPSVVWQCTTRPATFAFVRSAEHDEEGAVLPFSLIFLSMKYGKWEQHFLRDAAALASVRSGTKRPE
jgi:hypothetical protein